MTVRRWIIFCREHISCIMLAFRNTKTKHLSHNPTKPNDHTMHCLLFRSPATGFELMSTTALVCSLSVEQVGLRAAGPQDLVQHVRPVGGRGADYGDSLYVIYSHNLEEAIK